MDAIWQALSDPRWSPYAVGVGIGVVSWLTFLLADKPLGVSTAFARSAGMIERAVRGPQVDRRPYYRRNPPVVDHEWMLVAGLLIGAAVAALLSGSVRWAWVPPMWAERFGGGAAGRVAVAFAGGVLVGFGARWGRGCTSGHGISGTLQLVLGSWLAAGCFFVGGIVTAFLLYGEG